MSRAIVQRGDSVLLIKRNKFGSLFHCLPGGAIEEAETAEQAALRELVEETTVVAEVVRKVYEEEIKQFGLSEYFLCTYKHGEPALARQAPEFAENEKGMNTYEPMWVKIDELGELRLLPHGVARRLVEDLKHGTWPDKVITVVEEETTEV